MKGELKTFLSALSFYTRIPLGAKIHLDDSALQKASKYLPLVGWIIGDFQTGIFFVTQYVFPLPVCILLSIIAGIIMTGALHEDGLVDVFDAFGGGSTKEDILRIMKDSRIGAYGLIGYTAFFFLKFELLMAIAHQSHFLLMTAFIAAQSTSRLLVFFFILIDKYVRADASSKAKTAVENQFSLIEIAFTITIGVLPLLFFHYNILLALIAVLSLTKLFLSRYFKKRIDGYTGDCLGAVQQISELLFYLTLVMLVMICHGISK